MKSPAVRVLIVAAKALKIDAKKLVEVAFVEVRLAIVEVEEVKLVMVPVETVRLDIVPVEEVKDEIVPVDEVRLDIVVVPNVLVPVTDSVPVAYRLVVDRLEVEALAKLV